VVGESTSVELHEKTHIKKKDKEKEKKAIDTKKEVL
jgi:hypothetical protein